MVVPTRVCCKTRYGFLEVCLCVYLRSVGDGVGFCSQAEFFCIPNRNTLSFLLYAEKMMKLLSFGQIHPYFPLLARRRALPRAWSSLLVSSFFSFAAVVAVVVVAVRLQ